MYDAADRCHLAPASAFVNRRQCQKPELHRSAAGRLAGPASIAWVRLSHLRVEQRTTVDVDAHRIGRRHHWRVEAAAYCPIMRPANRLAARVLMLTRQETAQNRANVRAIGEARLAWSDFLEIVVPGDGFEPPTLRFSVACSTN